MIGFKRGDTMIEVLLGITVFSIILLGAQNAMNNSLSTTKSSLESTQVRSMIDSQASLLRFLQNSYVFAKSAKTDAFLSGTPAETWNIMRSFVSGNTVVTNFGVGSTSCPDIPTNSFVINQKNTTIFKKSDDASNTKFVKASAGIPNIIYNNDSSINVTGIWIEAYNQSGSNYIDFYIRACWYTIGIKNPNTLATIVRLNAN